MLIGGEVLLSIRLPFTKRFVQLADGEAGGDRGGEGDHEDGEGGVEVKEVGVGRDGGSRGEVTEKVGWRWKR